MTVDRNLAKGRLLSRALLEADAAGKGIGELRQAVAQGRIQAFDPNDGDIPIADIVRAQIDWPGNTVTTKEPSQFAGLFSSRVRRMVMLDGDEFLAWLHGEKRREEPVAISAIAPETPGSGRGRKPGDGSYDRHDQPYIEEVLSMVVRENMSPWKACQTVAEREDNRPPGASPDAIAKRLLHKVKARSPATNSPENI